MSKSLFQAMWVSSKFLQTHHPVGTGFVTTVAMKTPEKLVANGKVVMYVVRGSVYSKAVFPLKLNLTVFVPDQTENKKEIQVKRYLTQSSVS